MNDAITNLQKTESFIKICSGILYFSEFRYNKIEVRLKDIDILFRNATIEISKNKRKIIITLDNNAIQTELNFKSVELLDTNLLIFEMKEVTKYLYTLLNMLNKINPSEIEGKVATGVMNINYNYEIKYTDIEENQNIPTILNRSLFYKLKNNETDWEVFNFLNDCVDSDFQESFFADKPWLKYLRLKISEERNKELIPLFIGEYEAPEGE